MKHMKRISAGHYVYNTFVVTQDKASSLSWVVTPKSAWAHLYVPNMKVRFVNKADARSFLDDLPKQYFATESRLKEAPIDEIAAIITTFD